ncbi:hypothetical protein NXV03_00500 (plasmid) [Phocaeicola vulgatus]|nr:hypothetical protein [Phocaeicola vulgatus]
MAVTVASGSVISITMFTMWLNGRPSPTGYSIEHLLRMLSGISMFPPYAFDLPVCGTASS